MREPGKQKIIPFDKGFYGGLKDTYANLTRYNLIPLGYYFGDDIVNDDCGFLRARPKIETFVKTATTALSPIACFKLSGYYYVIPSTGKILRCTSTTTPTWVEVTNSPTYTSKINVDYVQTPLSTTPLAIVSTGYSAQYIAAVDGGSATVPSTGNQKGLAAPDEGRLFTIYNNLMYYSVRFDYTHGYDNGEDGDDNGGYLAIPEVCDDLVSLKNVAGSLYVIQSSSNTERTYIWKKMETYSDETELLDFTSFTQVLGIDDCCIKNGNDGIGVIGGNIVFWARGSGLNIVTNQGAQVVSEAIQAWNPAGLDYDCIIATDQRSKNIFVKETGSTITYVYNLATKVWSRWNINVTCKGYGQSGGMFGIASTYAPAYVGAYDTAGTDTTIVPTLYTPVLDFEAPDKEKFITSIHCAGAGISSITPYYRLTPDDTFTAGTTITSPDIISYLEGNDRFGECYLKITGTSKFMLKELKITYDIGDLIWEA